MLKLDQVDRATFDPLVGETFEIVFPDGRIALKLAGVRAVTGTLADAKREPFALTFHGEPKVRLPQQIYRIEQASLGQFDLFLVQVGADASNSEFEAVFS